MGAASRLVSAAVLVFCLACGKQEQPPPAPAARPEGDRPATLPSGYRVDAKLPAGSILVQVSAVKAAEPKAAAIPEAHKARNPADAAFCEGCASRGELLDEGLLVDPKSLGVRNVAVSLKSVAAGPKAPLSPATIDNACCRFAPHVAFAPVGARVMLRNSDPMSHAVFIGTLSGTQLFSVTIPTGEKAETTTIDAPGILEVTCPIHSWMRGWIIATRHPYVAVTDDRGAARLEQVPAGPQEVVLWHERLGVAARPVTVTAGAEERVVLSDSDFKKR